MKKRVLSILFSVVISVALCMGFTACGNSDQAADPDQTQEAQGELDDPEEDMPIEDEEMAEKEELMLEAEENAEETPVLPTMKYEDFIGSWETVTEKSDDTFGGYKITFSKDMTFKAVITGEEETGTCTFEEGVVTAQNEVVNDQFWFNTDKIMVVRDSNGAMGMLKKVK